MWYQFWFFSRSHFFQFIVWHLNWINILISCGPWFAPVLKLIEEVLIILKHVWIFIGVVYLNFVVTIDSISEIIYIVVIHSNMNEIFLTTMGFINIPSAALQDIPNLRINFKLFFSLQYLVTNKHFNTALAYINNLKLIFSTNGTIKPQIYFTIPSSSPMPTNLSKKDLFKLATYCPKALSA